MRKEKYNNKNGIHLKNELFDLMNSWHFFPPLPLSLSLSLMTAVWRRAWPKAHQQYSDGGREERWDKKKGLGDERGVEMERIGERKERTSEQRREESSWVAEERWVEEWVREKDQVEEKIGRGGEERRGKERKGEKERKKAEQRRGTTEKRRRVEDGECWMLCWLNSCLCLERSESP